MSAILNPIINSKLKAAAIHACVSLIVALWTGSVVFFVWYPGQMAEMLGGVELFSLIVIVEVALGPAISLVIFNNKKPKSELVRDYTLIAVVQLSALAYGLYVVALSRPVFTVFVKDRIEIMTSLELDEKDVLDAPLEYQSLSWLGPVNVCTESPVDPQENSDLLFSALAGKDIQFFPKYYRACNEGEILSKSFDKEKLETVLELKQPSEQTYTLPEGDFTWLPAKNRFSTWVKLYPTDQEGRVYLPINPF